MLDIYTSDWLAERLQDRTKRGIARDGTLPVGTKLPPVRDLAYALAVSPATISEAFSELRKQKIISGRGRHGTWVSGDYFAAKPSRLMSTGHFGPEILDLTRAIPDSLLLPNLEKALLHGSKAESLNSYYRVRILPELEEAVRSNWPYSPEEFLATNGGYNAVYNLLHALLPAGAPIAIENPTAMRLLDILEDMNVPIIAVDCDEEGPLPDSLRAAIAQKPSAFLFQPRLHSVTSHNVSQQRMEALGDVLAETDIFIIEDDGVGDVTKEPRQSLGERFPDRVIHILSYSKSLGPDLRLAVLSSSRSIIEQVQGYRSFSSGWTSRILQGAVAWLLKDEETQENLKKTQLLYEQRADRFIRGLADKGIHIPKVSGLCCTVPVFSEAYAMVTLAARQIAVAPGMKFSTQQTSSVRVATSILPEDKLAYVLDSLVLAAAGP